MSSTHAHEHHNAFAGQGAVLLDIGADAGALVIRMPAALDGAEVEIRPVPGPVAGPLRHVGVVARPTAAGHVHSAVFDGLDAGEYELYVRPDGPVQLAAAVHGGEVTFADWPC
jgi:hypothetical protein